MGHLPAMLLVLIGIAGISGCNDTGFSLREGLPAPNSTICVQNPNAEACSRTPVVTHPGVVTILFTLSQIPQGAGSLILSNAIKYASPSANPRILFLKDSNTHGEDEGDPDYIKNTLLAGYQVEYRAILPGGLRPDEIGPRDLIIVSNPGHQLTDAQTLATLDQFAGGVILIGDDIAQGAGFSMAAFTGLTFRGNGSSVTCNGNTYQYDNLKGYEYQVTMNADFLPGIPDSDKNYGYGNDIDHTDASTGVQVLASARSAPNTCDIGAIPAVVRRPK